MAERTETVNEVQQKAKKENYFTEGSLITTKRFFVFSEVKGSLSEVAFTFQV